MGGGGGGALTSSSERNRKSSSGCLQPKKSQAGPALPTPACCRDAWRCCRNPKKGATPVPGPIISSGHSTVLGGWKGPPDLQRQAQLSELHLKNQMSATDQSQPILCHLLSICTFSLPDLLMIHWSRRSWAWRNVCLQSGGQKWLTPALPGLER